MKLTQMSLSGAALAGALMAGSLFLAPQAEAAPKKVLVVTTTTGFRHSSIPVAERIIAELGKSSDTYTVEYARVEPNDAQYKGADGKADKTKVEDAIKAVLAEKMSAAALKNYDAIVFANTTGDLPLPDKEAFLNWIKSGKGFVGMHSAADTFHGFAGYIDMLGAEFLTHKAQVEVNPIIQDKECPACKHLDSNWKVFDEIYIMKNFNPARVHGLLTLNEHPNDKTPGTYPLSWCRQYGQGRVFYTSLGHREDVWDPKWPDRKNAPEIAEAYQKHILNGIKWAVGLEKWNVKQEKLD
jgi:type 1 glutamine amidotransferase